MATYVYASSQGQRTYSARTNYNCVTDTVLYFSRIYFLFLIFSFWMQEMRFLIITNIPISVNEILDIHQTNLCFTYSFNSVNFVLTLSPTCIA